MIAIIDYGTGNLRSVQKAFEKVGARAVITQNAHDIEKAQKVVLPGVGAMEPAMKTLAQMNLINPIREAIDSNKPFLGICLGLQLLFEKSAEGGSIKGLSILPGSVNRFTALKVPHMGWNQITKTTPCALFNGIDDAAHFYFCHSYYVSPMDTNVSSTLTDYGVSFTSSIHKGNIFGVQFHPEKSQTNGLKILENFVKLP